MKLLLCSLYATFWKQVTKSSSHLRRGVTKHLLEERNLHCYSGFFNYLFIIIYLYWYEFVDIYFIFWITILHEVIYSVVQTVPALAAGSVSGWSLHPLDVFPSFSFLSTSLLPGIAKCSSLILYFLFLALESANSPRVFGFFYWGIVFRNHDLNVGLFFICLVFCVSIINTPQMFQLICQLLFKFYL